MNIYPSVEEFLEWAVMYKRVPILGAKKIPPFSLAYGNPMKIKKNYYKKK